ncbi:MAG: 3'(2'),5'-bisphosphate nucleotidase CysQ [Saprospiraceae bacterium]|nr:3'(2'),5'-bisphosphate nucleotidase CysQ [Saprospiraceae bacterium]
MNQYIQHLAEVKQIAQRAGEAIMEIYNNASDIEIVKKTDDSPLTVADRTANGIICDGLEQLATVYPIISEENKLVEYEERKNYEYYWLVDPLDGTKEFIKRNGEFTVNIALVKGQKVVMGVVYAPVLDELYWAAEGEGAYKTKHETTSRLHAETFTWKDQGLNVVCSRSHLNESTQKIVNELDTPNLVPKGSSLKFLILAMGDAHIYPRLAPTMEWDTAAAQIILEEAGGIVYDYNTNKPLRYNKENLLNPYFMALGKKEA